MGQIKKKKVLVVASVISFIEWFLRDNLDFFTTALGCEVHVACNTGYMEDTSEERTLAFLSDAQARGIVFHNINFARSPLGKSNFGAYRELKKLIDSADFDMIHCHTPMASILCRLAARRARKKGTVVIYTCHGYHFFKGAPLRNWLLFYPAEKLCSGMCDVLININREDYDLSVKKMKTRRIEYIPGVGVDLAKFDSVCADRDAKRAELGLPADACVILSVGELNENKNHSAVIRALAGMKDKNAIYLVAGCGEYEEKLHELARASGVEDRVRLLGFRRDVAELLKAADVFAFTSFREGLPVALMEAMASGLPIVASGIRGNTDLVVDGKGGFLCRPDDVTAIAEKITVLAESPELREEFGAFNRAYIRDFSSDVVKKKTEALYYDVLGGRAQE